MITNPYDCTIQDAVKPPQSGNMTNLPKEILSRPDIVMIVTGSLACIRGIYKTVSSLGKLHQLHYCLISEKDYQNNAWIDIYTKEINNVLKRQNLGGIIIYAGCLDVLHKVNLSRVIPLLENPRQIPIKILFRGPVAKSMYNPKDALKEILSQIPNTGLSLEKDGFLIPPLLPDFVGVGAMLDDLDSTNIVLDIGGCSACISPSDNNEYKHLKKTSFNGYESLKQYKNFLGQAISEENNKDSKEVCFLLETPVIKKSELDIEWLQRELKKNDILSVNLDTDGYKSSIEGIADTLLKFGKQAKKLCSNKELFTDSKLIGVLGADRCQSSFRDKIHHGIEHFTKDGYSALFPEELHWNNMDKMATVKINWVVSSVAIPLAKYMKKEFGIPYFCALPIGARAMFLWRNQVNTMMHNDKVTLLEVPPIAMPKKMQKKVLIVGDPILSSGIKRYFVAMEGYINVDRAIYAPIASFQDFCTKVIKDEHANGLKDEVLSIQDSPILFKDTGEWKKIASQYDIIVCDKLLQLCLGEIDRDILWINIPDGILSTGLVEQENYTIFGKKGAAWLRTIQKIPTEDMGMM